MGSNDNLSCHSERSKDSVQKLTECQVLDGDSAEEKQLNVAFLRGLSEIQSISVAYSDLNREILQSHPFLQNDDLTCRPESTTRHSERSEESKK